MTNMFIVFIELRTHINIYCINIRLFMRMYMQAYSNVCYIRVYVGVCGRVRMCANGSSLAFYFLL